MRGLDGKTFVVAGGGTGIGAATARRLAAEGASVVVGDLTTDLAEPVVERIRAAGGAATGIAFDMRTESSVHDLIEIAMSVYGRLDGLHANAADIGATREDTDAVTVDLDIFDRSIAVNLRGHLLCTRYAVPHLLATGGGSIVYTSSLAAYLGEPKRVSYAVSKSGLHALMRHVASRWGKEGIRANVVAPGMVMTEINQGAKQIWLDRAIAGTRSTRLGEPGDIAAMVTHLMSDDGAWVNGQVINVDGGVVLRP